MQQRLTATPVGEARLLIDGAEEPRATVVLGHGAGGDVHARDLAALAAALPPSGISVVRVEQPWLVAGKRVAPPPAVLDRAWQAAVGAVEPRGPLVLGGRSAGARVACRTATALGAAGVVCLAFPLHPPGRPERSRFGELAGAGVPVLVVQGERDAFGRPAEFPNGTYELAVVPHADHGMAVPKSHSQDAATGAVVRHVKAWLGNALGVR